MPRKGENIYKRKDGRWEGRFPESYNLNGKVKYKSVYAASYTEVREKLKGCKKTVCQISCQKFKTCKILHRMA